MQLTLGLSSLHYIDGMAVSDAQETQKCPVGGNYGEENSGFET